MSSTLIIHPNSAWMVRSQFFDYVIESITAHLQHSELVDLMKAAQENGDPQCI